MRMWIPAVLLALLGLPRVARAQDAWVYYHPTYMSYADVADLVGGEAAVGGGGDVAEVVGAGAAVDDPQFVQRHEHIDGVACSDLTKLEIGPRGHIRFGRIPAARDGLRPRPCYEESPPTRRVEDRRR